MAIDVKNLREEYGGADDLTKNKVLDNPVKQFEVWFRQALKANIPEPNAMTLATADKTGRPSARIVLLKGFDENGFVFYTNYGSQKGKELAENPRAALVFLWLEQHRQVRIEGTVVKVDENTATEYFQSRPRGSQVGAWASDQSSVIEDREALQQMAKRVEEQYKDEETLPKPEFWGGYRVNPTLIEFWQGQASRLHDRIQYTLQENGNWTIERLSP